jgi:hypothetical protein
MPPAPSQTFGPAVRIKAFVCCPNWREGETKKERKRKEFGDHFTAGPIIQPAGRLKFKIQNSKSQTNSKSQIPNSKRILCFYFQFSAGEARYLELGTWNLEPVL